jgi:hypothetical protein
VRRRTPAESLEYLAGQSFGAALALGTVDRLDADLAEEARKIAVDLERAGGRLQCLAQQAREREGAKT